MCPVSNNTLGSHGVDASTYSPLVPKNSIFGRRKLLVLLGGRVSNTFKNCDVVVPVIVMLNVPCLVDTVEVDVVSVS